MSARPSPSLPPHPVRPRHPLLVALFLLAAVFLPACSTPPTLSGPDSYAVGTSSTYTENRVLYLDDPVPGEPLRNLLHPYQVLDRYRATLSRDLQPGDFDDLSGASVVLSSQSQFLEHNDPLAVIVSGVWLPENMRGRRDIAVLLDLETSSDSGPQSIVVFYQREVPGGQLLSFRDLLVYFDPLWDSAFAPHFRLRVLDVSSERNQRTRELLDRVSQSSSAVGALIPHPAVPGIALAIEAARQLIASRENSVLLDYTVQLYSRHQADLAGGADLGVLRSGSWLALGRPGGRGSDFWQAPLVIDRASGQVYQRSVSQTGTEIGSPVMAPYFLISVSAADVQIPRAVLERSEDLRQLLRAPNSAADSGSLLAAADALAGSIRVYTAERRLKRFRSVAAMDELMNVLLAHESLVGRNLPGLLLPADLQSIMFLLRQLTGRPDLNTSSATSWWFDEGGASGRIIDAPETRLGFKWAPAQ